MMVPIKMFAHFGSLDSLLLYRGKWALVVLEVTAAAPLDDSTDAN